MAHIGVNIVYSQVIILLDLRKHRFCQPLHDCVKQLRAVKKIDDALAKGQNFSVSLGKMEGLDPLAPGSGGPFEAIYRLQDVAMNLGTGHEGKDTRQWYQQYFGGMGFEQASAIAKGVVTDFQRGNYTDDVLKYIDVEKLRATIQGDANAEASQARLAKLIGADANTLKALTGQDLAGKGVVLSDADAQAMAASLKAGVMSGLDKVAAEQPTVMQSLLGAAAGGQQVDFGGTLVPAIVKAVDAELVANGKQLEERGGQAWTLMETGFIAKAKQSAAFALAVEAMVENSLKQYLPTN